MSKIENERIAKNTMFLYFRMMLIMLVSLYTSRVTLQVLGVDDFGIYQTVGGVVTFLAFLSNALGGGTSRFITFEMGKDSPRLDILFSTVQVAHFVLGIVVVFLGEIIGLWFIRYKLVIPEGRVSAATLAFHFSMVATFFQITQIPYNAIIIAYERMNVYAYVSIVEAGLKLAIVYILRIIAFDKLEIYAIFMCLVTVVIMIIYRIYCRCNFKEARTRLTFNAEMFRGVGFFSGWNLLTSSAASLANQGVTIVTNMFFPPAIVTVRTLALRINNVINNFIGNFRTAVNPQIVKRYAAKDYEGSKKLAIASTKYTYYLMLMIVLPLFLLVEPALKIWLGEVPDGLMLFVRIALIQGLFQALDTSLYVPIYTKGQIKENAIISPIFDFIQLPIVYVLFKLGYPAISLAWVELFAYVALGIVVKPILLKYIVKYNLKETLSMIFQCLFITLISLGIPVIVFYFTNVNSFSGFCAVFATSEISVAVFVWFFGLECNVRSMIIKWLKIKCVKNYKY